MDSEVLTRARNDFGKPVRSSRIRPSLVRRPSSKQGCIGKFETKTGSLDDILPKSFDRANAVGSMLLAASRRRDSCLISREGSNLVALLHRNSTSGVASRSFAD